MNLGVPDDVCFHVPVRPMIDADGKEEAETQHLEFRTWEVHTPKSYIPPENPERMDQSHRACFHWAAQLAEVLRTCTMCGITLKNFVDVFRIVTTSNGMYRRVIEYLYIGSEQTLEGMLFPMTSNDFTQIIPLSALPALVVAVIPSLSEHVWNLSTILLDVEHRIEIYLNTNPPAKYMIKWYFQLFRASFEREKLRGLNSAYSFILASRRSDLRIDKLESLVVDLQKRLKAQEVKNAAFFKQMSFSAERKRKREESEESQESSDFSDKSPRASLFSSDGSSKTIFHRPPFHRS